MEVSVETILVKICIQSFLIDVFLEVFRGGVLSWGLLLIMFCDGDLFKILLWQRSLLFFLVEASLHILLCRECPFRIFQ